MSGIAEGRAIVVVIVTLMAIVTLAIGVVIVIVIVTIVVIVLRWRNFAVAELKVHKSNVVRSVVVSADPLAIADLGNRLVENMG